MVLSIDDEIATCHLKKCKKLSSISKPLLFIGSLLVAIPVCSQVAGGDVNQFVLFPGLGLTVTGVVLTIKSDQEKHKSVKRYNQVVEDEWGMFFQYSPKNKRLGLALNHSL
jgi:hypothetical protein